MVEVVGPRLGVDDLTSEPVHALPLGGVAGTVAVVPLAHPQEVAGEPDLLPGVGAGHVEGPAPVLGRPGGRRDRVAVADVAVDVVVVDHLTHVREDLLAGGDGRTGPGLEPVPEGVEVAVGTDTGKGVRLPGAPEVVHRLEDHVRLVGTLLLEVVGATHAGDAGTHDQDVEVLGRRSGFHRLGLHHAGIVHHWAHRCHIRAGFTGQRRNTRRITRVPSGRWPRR